MALFAAAQRFWHEASAPLCSAMSEVGVTTDMAGRARK